MKIHKSRLITADFMTFYGMDYPQSAPQVLRTTSTGFNYLNGQT